MSNKSSHSPPPTNSQSDNKSKDSKSTPPPPPPPPPSNSNSSSPPPPKDSQHDKKSKDDTSTPPSKSNSSPPSPPSWLSSKVSSPTKTSSPQSSPTPSKSHPPPSPPPPSPSRKESPPPPSPPPPPNKKHPSPPPPPKEQSEPPPSPPPSDEESPQSSPEKTPPPPVISPPPSSTTNPTPPPSSSNTLEASTSLPVVSPTPANVSIKASPELSPDALASHAVLSPPNSSSNASDGPSPSGGSSNQTQSKTNNVKNTNQGVIINATVAGAVVLIAFIALFFLIKRRRRNKQPSLPGNHTTPPANVELKSDVAYYKSKFDGKESTLVNSSETLKGPNYHGPESGIITGSKTFFTYEELMEITDGFARENVIGEGGFGCVYKGRIPEGRLVAVKRLKVGSGQGEREFKAEVEIISRIHHRHLVSLVGYCIAENQRLLIYDFVRNKTLEHHLHGKGMPVLEWANRVKIAIGAAKGLAYLHEDCQPRIIHRDIKPANILLEDDFEAQVADFGLARLNDTSQTHVSTRVMGTFGYLAPEYASSGKLTDRSDVFSFGVVLLELITGRKSVDSTRPLGDESLVEWARPVLIQAIESGDISKIIDPRLEKRYVESEVLTMTEAAAACVRHSAAKRPRMALVLRALDYEGWDLSNGVKVGESSDYDSANYSEDIA